MLPEWSDVYVAARATGVVMLLVSVPLVLGWVARVAQRGPRRYCPGPRARWRAWLSPLTWMARTGCGYDVSGLRPDEGGNVCCPECGRRVLVERQAHRQQQKWRLGVMACVLGTGGSGLLYSVAAHSGRWQDAVPTTVLLAAKHTMRHRIPGRLHRELEHRIYQDELASWQRTIAATAFLRDLRDDGQASNAVRARGVLYSVHLTDEELEARLDSTDRQERQLIAAMLRDRRGPDSLIAPSLRLLEVTAEGLRADDIDWYSTYTDNAEEAFWYLVDFPDRIGRFIEEGLLRGDEQERFLCAALAGYTRKVEFIPLAAPVLIGHLRDNETTGDARFAARSLYQFGPEVTPYLMMYAEAEDRQLAAAVRLLLKDLGTPRPAPAGEEPRLSHLVHDPAKEDYGLRVPWGLRR